MFDTVSVAVGRVLEMALVFTAQDSLPRGPAPRW